ncbi:MAG: hypothetical protein KAI47_02505, partial [Deltaproteobacteria bacterium]|nr:hypothetical protein [Deltaproteobacteria bacterium]
MDSIADVIAILEREIEHLAGKSPRLGPLQTSLALLYWDLEDDPQRAHETLTENNASYFVARLRHQLLIATEDLEGAINALASHAAVSSSFLGDDAGLLLERITSLRIYWLRDLEGAAETAIRGLEEKGRSDESRERLFRSAFLALANTNDDALITLAESHADTPAWLLRAATRSAWEGLKDGKRAKSLLDRLAPASLQVAPLAFEVAIAIKDDEAQIATLRQTLEVLRKSSDETGFPPEGIAEIARVAQELARLLIDSGDLDAADQLITHVAAWQDTPTESGAGLLTRQFELALRRDVAIQRHDLDSLVEIYGALRDLSASPDIQKAYTARLIELADDVDETLGPHHAPELSTPPKNREDSEEGPPPTLEKPGANTDDALPPQMEGEAPPESSPASPAPTNHDTPMVGDVVAIDDAMLL